MATAAGEVIDVGAWVDRNVTPYGGDAAFLAGPTERTRELLATVAGLLAEERAAGGVLSVDASTPSTITSHPAAVLGPADTVVVGLQARQPLCRCIKPSGGLRVVEAALRENGAELPASIKEAFSWTTTHNEGCFALYTDEMRAARKAHVLTGLPDAYGRGRLLGDFRRVALYGVDALADAKKQDARRVARAAPAIGEKALRTRAEVAAQLKALSQLKELGDSYGFDLSRPARSAREATQWTYFAYLACCKQQDGAAISFGRVDSFLDIFIENDLASGALGSEAEAQELIDHLVIKLRLVRHLRPKAYDAIFAGDPVWSTVALAGCRLDGQHLVTRTSFRFLNTLRTCGPAPEPNITVLWAEALPEPFKLFATAVTRETNSLQYENDDLMRTAMRSSDYAISCCVSALRLGKDAQYFGARCNLPKLLLYALNGGRDELSGAQVAPRWEVPPAGEALQWADVKARFETALDWMCGLYVSTMNTIHYSHDRYNYESMQYALTDTEPHHYMAFGIAGLSVIADSLSAIKHAEVVPERDERGLTVGFKTTGDFAKFGNDDDSADSLAVWVAKAFSKRLASHTCYRGAQPTVSVLTITSNVMYGEHTGATPDGREQGAPFAPGANPMHGRETHGALSALNSVAKIPYKHCMDGISNTFSLAPTTLGKMTEDARSANLAAIIGGYFEQGGQHLNVNVVTRDMLEDAMDNPEKYPNLTIRVSGYAVRFIRLSRTQQQEVIDRTIHAHV